MAEALAVVGVVASIIQLIDFSTKVISRLDEFQSEASEVPKSLRHVKAELPLLQTTLHQMKDAIDSGLVTEKSQQALTPVIAGCNDQIAELDVILTKTLPESGDSWSKRGRKAVVSLNQDAKVGSITKVLQNYVGILTFYCAASSSTLQAPIDTKLNKIRQWLAAPDPSTNYHKALKLRQADTGLWLLQNENYIQWKTSTACASPLWLYGIPGCGKTVLNSTIVQDVLQHCQGDAGKATAYFYFDFNDALKQDPQMMVRSLLSQLSLLMNHPTSLISLFTSCENGERQPSTLALTEALQCLVDDLPRTYILLDALDECSDRTEIMDMIQAMTKWNSLRLLVTSRRERDIEDSLAQYVIEENKICLQSSLVDQDIQLYVRQRLSQDKRLIKWKKDAHIMSAIESALRNGANGMFRWAVCQLDELGKCVNRKMLQRALTTLPPTLDLTYDRILSSISPEYLPYASRVLKWLAFAFRPLKIEEVAQLVAIDRGRDPVFDPDEILEDPLEVLSICSSLVSMVTQNEWQGQEPERVFVLAHYSVKEYLVSDRIRTGKAAIYGMQEEECHGDIASGCLGYLLQLPPPETSWHVFKTFCLGRYAAEFWIQHTRKAGRKRQDTKRMLSLFSNANPTYFSWVRWYNHDQPNLSPEYWVEEGKSIPSPMYFAALLGLTDVVKHQLQDEENVQPLGGLYFFPLQAASSKGHYEIVELLLNNKADLDIPRPNLRMGPSIVFSHPLTVASFGGHDEVVRLLLDFGANINAAKDDHNGTALQAASKQNHKSLVKFLIDAGADVNAQGGHYGNALQAACAQNHRSVADLLIKAGADVNAQGGNYGNALQAASWGYAKELVLMLLDLGADINATGGHFGSALQAASFAGDSDIVQLLLDNNADVNAKCGQFGSALQAALSEGEMEVVKLLLHRGAELQTIDIIGRSPLLIAAENGNDSFVRRQLHSIGRSEHAKLDTTALLDEVIKAELQVVAQIVMNMDAAELNSLSIDLGCPPLVWAARFGHLSILELMLDKESISTNRTDRYAQTALLWAAANGHEKIVSLLLLDKYGPLLTISDVHDEHRQTPLLWAAMNGHNGVVKLLVDAGAKLDATDARGRAPLALAALNGHEDVVRTLEKALAMHECDVSMHLQSV